jgi:mannosyl-glycoprotein endo-beta-N-acetylglucosaminidase
MRPLPRRNRATLALPFAALLCVSLTAGPTAAQLDPAPHSAPPSATMRALPADQPFASYWFPNDLLTWTPATDDDAEYNKSHTPLRDRFLNEIQVNAHARPNEARISPLDIFWATSGNPSQGALDVNYFAFN